MPTLFEAKGQASLLHKYLSSIGHPIPHSLCLEAIARSRGAPNWNVFQSKVSSLDSRPLPTPHSGVSRPPEEAPDSQTTAETRLHWSQLSVICQQAQRRQVGSVHITSTDRHNAVSIKFRIRGMLEEVAVLNGSQGFELGLALAASMLEGKANTGNPCRTAGVRTTSGIVEISIVKMVLVNGTSFVLHIPRSPSDELTLSDMNLSCLGEWMKDAQRKRGLTLLGGHTGSGRTTLLEATARAVKAETPANARQPDYSVVSMSDLMDMEGQRTGLSRRLRVRDADVYLFEDLRTYEHLRVALDLCETGHRVYASIQAQPDCAMALKRLMTLVPMEDKSRVEQWVERNLQSVIVQALVPTVCVHCDGSGCEHCHSTGRGPLELLTAFNTAVGRRADLTPAGENGRMAVYKTLRDDFDLKRMDGVRFHPDVEQLL